MRVGEWGEANVSLTKKQQKEQKRESDLFNPQRLHCCHVPCPLPVTLLEIYKNLSVILALSKADSVLKILDFCN